MVTQILRGGTKSSAQSAAQQKRIAREFDEGYAAYTAGQIARLREVSGAAPDEYILERYITVADAAKHLGLSRQRVYQIIRTGQVQAVQVGDFYRVWLVNRETMPPARVKP